MESKLKNQMGGFEDHVGINGDWMFPNLSTRSFFSSTMNDDMLVGSHSEPVIEKRNHPLFPESEMRGFASGDTDEKEATAADIKCEKLKSNTLVVNSRGNLVERMTARSGFKAPRLNTESFRLPDIPKNSDGQQPFVMTIPPGLSPTSLLESPVFLNNSQVMPSPTTGKFCLAPCGNSKVSVDQLLELSFRDSSPFEFKRITEPRSFGLQSLPGAVDSNFQRNLEPLNFQSYANSQGKEISVHSVNVAESSPHFDDPTENGNQSGGDQIESPDDDGYCWRKYGQKQVKGSECPRSYYKCTSANCPVKKKVERSHEGHITEIIYTGAHNHSKPSSDTRALIGSSTVHSDSYHLESDSRGGGVNNSDLVWSSGKQQWSKENHEASSSVPMEYSNGGGVDGSSNFSNDDDLAQDGDEEEDESDSKRRRHETHIPEMNGASRAIREPRVVVQTTSDVDILDDGYRWRKYGQKVVKGNPNPRSYYKCTSPGCNVRKHVERASHDLKAVITTYEGKHNHDVPVAKNSSHVNSGNSNCHQPPPMPAPSHIHQLEPPGMLTNIPHFGRPEMGGPMCGFGVNQTGIPNLRFVANQGKLPVLPSHPYSGQQSQPVSLMMPKFEPMTTDSLGSRSCDGSSMYQQFMR